MRSCTLVAAIAGLALPSIAAAQWVEFDDETGARLQLQPFVDGTSHTNDKEEKDTVVADLDKDGWDDLIIARKRIFSNAGARQDVLLMNQQGVLVDMTATFAPGFLTDLTDARDIICADFNGDGWDDVVICTTFDDDPKFYLNLGDDGNGNWLGLGDETSSRMPFSGIGAQSKPFKMCAISAGDFDNDGDLDTYWSNYEGGDDLLLINDGNGFFTDGTVAKVGSLANSAFGTQNRFIDMDQDGDLDIVKNTTLFNQSPFQIGIYILWNNGAPNYNYTQFSAVPATTSPYMFMLGDMDNSGTDDIYVVQDPQDSIHHVTNINGSNNLSWANFNVSGSPRTSGFGGNSYFADMDNDGDIDASVGPIDVDIQNCFQNQDMALLRNPGNGLVSDPWPANQDQNFHTDSHDVAIFDINKDGCLDMFMSGCTHYNIFIQSESAFCEPATGCAADCNGDGNLNILDFTCFQALFSSGQGDFNGDGDQNILDFIAYQAAFEAGC